MPEQFLFCYSKKTLFCMNCFLIFNCCGDILCGRVNAKMGSKPPQAGGRVICQSWSRVVASCHFTITLCSKIKFAITTLILEDVPFKLYIEVICHSLFIPEQKILIKIGFRNNLSQNPIFPMDRKPDFSKIFVRAHNMML